MYQISRFKKSLVLAPESDIKLTRLEVFIFLCPLSWRREQLDGKGWRNYVIISLRPMICQRMFVGVADIASRYREQSIRREGRAASSVMACDGWCDCHRRAAWSWDIAIFARLSRVLQSCTSRCSTITRRSSTSFWTPVTVSWCWPSTRRTSIAIRRACTSQSLTATQRSSSDWCCLSPARFAAASRYAFALRIITGPPNGPVLFCWLASIVVCRRRL